MVLEVGKSELCVLPGICVEIFEDGVLLEETLDCFSFSEI